MDKAMNRRVVEKELHLLSLLFFAWYILINQEKQ